MQRFVFYSVLLTLIASTNRIVQCAPRKSSTTTFDQKQSGEYNIQLHLKDFQIIAVVGDDSFSNFGDYDYSYDYSDFTVKPSTTKKPETGTNATTPLELNLDLLTTKKPFNAHPYPIVSPSTEAAILSSTTTTAPTSVTTEIPVKTNPESSTTQASVVNATQTISTSVTKKENVTVISTTPTPRPRIQIPGQIPVIIQEFTALRNDKPIIKETKHHEKKSDTVTSVTIVPLDDLVDSNVSSDDKFGEQPALGEILHYRRCAQGFQRDKRGRCRKVRRPQIPLGLTKFASNLAARFRHAGYSSEDSTTTKETEIQ